MSGLATVDLAALTGANHSACWATRLALDRKAVTMSRILEEAITYVDPEHCKGCVDLGRDTPAEPQVERDESSRDCCCDPGAVTFDLHVCSYFLRTVVVVWSE